MKTLELEGGLFGLLVLTNNSPARREDPARAECESREEFSLGCYVKGVSLLRSQLCSKLLMNERVSWGVCLVALLWRRLRQ